MQIDDLLKKRKVIITCGTGGVGKTTLSAALAIRAATLGLKTVVVTIDPAKRLATSLGLETLGDEPMDLTARLVGKVPRDKELGSLHAIMPDTKKTLDCFVSELTPSAETAKRLRQNPIFQIFAREFSGTNEYMAMEKLHSLVREGRFDTIILDTPPSRNTLAFLNAPKLLSRFFDERLLRWLVLPANRFFSLGVRKALGLLEKLTGAQFMTSLFEFANALFEVQARFTANLRSILELLGSEKVGFLMVITPALDKVGEVTHFIDTLGKNGFRFDGVAINRTLSYLGTAVQGSTSNPEVPKQALDVVQGLCFQEEKVHHELSKLMLPYCVKLPELARDVHSVEDLFHVAMVFDSDCRSHDGRIFFD